MPTHKQNTAQKEVISTPALTTGAPSTNLSPWTYGERRLMEALAANKTLSQACAASGMSAGHATAFALRMDVRQALHDVRDAFVLTTLQPMALQCAQAILADPEASTATRAKLAMSVLAYTAKVREAEIDGTLTPMEEMAPDELMRLAAHMRETIKVDSLTIEHEPPYGPPEHNEDALF